MLKIIKLVSVDTQEVVESKLDTLKKTHNMDSSDEFSVANLLEMAVKNSFHIDINDSTSIIFTEEGGHFFYFLDVFSMAKVNFVTEDMTNIYSENKLDEFVTEDMKESLNKVLINTLSVNDVLDKISVSGIDSLNSVDKMILESF
jgi:hypothetical protein